MELKSDITLTGECWQIAEDKLHNRLFKSQWGIFKLCLTIGILYDKQLDDVGDTKDATAPMNIPRTMFNRNSKDMQVCFQTAILTSNCIDLSEKDRLYLAFSEDISEDDLDGEDADVLKIGVSDNALSFDKSGFLRKFANYGVTKIVDCITDNDIETMENIRDFIKDSIDGTTDEMIDLYSVEDIDEI